MRRRDAVVTCLLWPLLLAATEAGFSAGARTLSGAVTDHGTAVKGAVVKIEQPKTLQIRSYITGPDGRYHFAGLRTDVDYEVWAQYQGRSSSRQTLSRFDSDRTRVLNLNIE